MHNIASFPGITRRHAGVLLVFAILFLIANRAAYRGYFSDDDFANLGNVHGTAWSDYIRPLVLPKVGMDAAYRVVPNIYYFATQRVAGTSFGPYVGVIQAVHLLNVVLVFLLLRTLGAQFTGAAAGALLFAFHAAALQIYWRPMFVFDLLCATFSLLTLLAYARNRWILALVFFWLALKSKEVAILLPVALAGYELILGERRWKRLIPFFAISGIIGLQALLQNRHREGDYSLRFTPATIWTCARFYASELTLAPAWVGFAALAAILPFLRNRLVRFGALTFVTLLLVMLVLPGRLEPAYLYAPLIGLAIVISAVTRPIWLVLFFVLWLPWNYRQLRIERKAELAAADERRAWHQVVATFVRQHPETDTFVYHNLPESLRPFGVGGAIRILRPAEASTGVIDVNSPEKSAAAAQPHLAVVVWDTVYHRTHVIPRTADLSYVQLSQIAPLWQLQEGWFTTERSYCWIGPHAVARLNRPADARKFEVLVFIPVVYIERLHRGEITISVDHVKIGSAALEKAEPTTFRFDLPPGHAGPVEVVFDVSPPLNDPGGTASVYGVPIAAFGFTP